MDYKMTDTDISKALKDPCYLDDPHETCGGCRDLIPLLKILRYKALHSTDVYEDAKEPEGAIIYPSHWLR